MPTLPPGEMYPGGSTQVALIDLGSSPSEGDPTTWVISTAAGSFVASYNVQVDNRRGWSVSTPPGPVTVSCPSNAAVGSYGLGFIVVSGDMAENYKGTFIVVPPGPAPPGPAPGPC